MGYPILDQGEHDDLYHECCEMWGGHSEDCTEVAG